MVRYRFAIFDPMIVNSRRHWLWTTSRAVMWAVCHVVNTCFEELDNGTDRGRSARFATPVLASLRRAFRGSDAGDQLQILQKEIDAATGSDRLGGLTGLIGTATDADDFVD